MMTFDDAMDLLQGLNINLLFTTFIIVFGSSFQFGYNIGVLNQVDEVRSLAAHSQSNNHYSYPLSRSPIIMSASADTSLHSATMRGTRLYSGPIRQSTVTTYNAAYRHIIVY